jgi:hypothetical protein
MLVTTCWECRTVPPSSSVVDIGVPPPVVQPGSKTEEAVARKGRKYQKRTPFFLCNERNRHAWAPAYYKYEAGPARNRPRGET